MVDLGPMILDKKHTLNEVIYLLKTKNKKFLQDETNKEGKIDYYLREEKNFKPGKIYLDGNKTLAEIGAKENDVLICQGINEKNIFIDEKEDNNNRLNFSVRFFDHKNWKMSECYEIFVNKNISAKDFHLKVLKNIIIVTKLECEDLNELEGLKIANNQLIYHLDDVLNNMAFISFRDFEDTFIYDYPFLLSSNGDLILIRYNCRDLREPTIEEMEYFYKSNQPETGKMKSKKCLPSSNKAQTTFKKEVYKEKAMKINVKKFDDNQK